MILSRKFQTLLRVKRSSFFFSLTLLSLNSYAALEGRWTGVAGVLVTDGETTILVDPVVTKPTLKHRMFNSVLEIDQEKVKEAIKIWNSPSVAAIFASHQHFDHASDIGAFAEQTNATVYGGESLHRIVKFQAPNVPFKFVKHEESLNIGKFKVTVFNRKHAAIIPALDYYFLPGKVPEDFKGNFYDFEEGEVMSFLLEHPEGNIIVDSGSRLYEPLAAYSGKILAYFMGISNNKSLDDVVAKQFGMIKPKYAIPIHFDFFFLKSETMEKWNIPGVKMDELSQIAKDKFPEMKFVIPELHQVIKF